MDLQRQTLEKECSKIVGFYKNTSTYLFRGSRQSRFKQDFIEKTMHDTRPPKDTPKHIHNYINRLYKAKFSWNVRDGVSTTGDLMIAGMYGDSYVVVPTNGFKFVWNTEQHDMTANLVNSMHLVPSPGGEYTTGDPEIIKTPEFRQWAFNYVDKSIATNLDRAIKSNHEIMIWSKKYYMVEYNLYQEMFKKANR